VPAAEGSQVPALKYEPSPLVSAGVSATTKNRAQAVQFIQFLTSKDQAALFAKTSIDLPATDLGAAASTLSPQLAAAIGTFGPSGGTTFSPNDFSADPGAGSGTATSGTAESLAKLVNKETTPDALAKQLTDLYAKAWASAS
jgi:multiple sugar transport system substrate-binding protein